MNALVNTLNLIQKIMTGIGAACLMGMALVTGADVVGRLFDHPIFGSEEIVTILATLVTGMALAYAHTQRSHIGVEIFMRKVPKRIRHKIMLFTDFLSFLLFSLVTWRMFLYAGTMKRSGEVSMNLELPEYYVIYALSFCFLIFTLRILGDFLAHFTRGEKS